MAREIIVDDLCSWVSVAGFHGKYIQHGGVGYMRDSWKESALSLSAVGSLVGFSIIITDLDARPMPDGLRDRLVLAWRPVSLG
ncbi:hypothetical protein EYZ11_011002 [Aspergillus tanneri]|uniref:Uncharacterized protein n=1 Tax=Aspergillus tanneri TaxID=1220188 RepID=A0A4S3J633_9EURO|nr:hypothetical protein EYZ11_011002 [Aspergillus tanneri]